MHSLRSRWANARGQVPEGLETSASFVFVNAGARHKGPAKLLFVAGQDHSLHHRPSPLEVACRSRCPCAGR